jgi:mono/diheme cytochrome c family protein
MAFLCCFSIGAAADDGDLPPTGRSRFDFLMGNAPMPYPLPRLIAHIRSQLEASGDGLSPLKITLIPLGRSLRRSVAAPDFFHFPSVVAAVDGDSKEGHTPLKDQLFLGYNERAEAVEIISYNEQAGRFEFQVIRDYRSGAQPKTYYASRALCLACHQNNAPIFSRPLWDETPANPAIASRLKATGRNFYGIPLSGTDISSAIDAAAERANLFQVWLQIWREACSNACRAQWLDAALAYAMSGNLPEADELKFADLEMRWKKTWPQGLGIPGSSIPNRDPFATVVEPPIKSHAVPSHPLAELAQLAHIPAQLEPLNPRPPLQRWTTPDKIKLVAGLAGLLNKADVQAFDRALVTHTKAQSHTLTLPCRFTHKPRRVVFNCTTSDLQLSGVIQNVGSALSGQIERLQVGHAKTAPDLTFSGRMTKAGQIELIPRHGASGVRLSDGRRWSRLQFNTSRADQGSATLTLIDDYADVRSALPRLPLMTTSIFDGSRALAELQAELGLDKREALARETLANKLPPAKLEIVAPRKLSGSAPRFLQYCGQCHDSTTNFPPNFLHGDDITVNTRLDHCAERIFYRLSMWHVVEAKRGKTTMPPISALAAYGFDAASWANSAPLADLLEAARQRIVTQGGQPDAVLTRPFEQLRSCLPSATP